MNCPLCLNTNIKHYHHDKWRDYWQCLHCLLVFVQAQDQLNSQDEKSIYDLHENSADDLGYQKFLNKLLVPLIKKLQVNATGLDFGSGPGPTISVMMQKQGFTVNNYDIFYANKPSVLNQKYDFVTCTEVIEHLYNPNQEIKLLYKILNTHGLLGIMTKRVLNQEKFKTWHYKNDLTHVCFYSDATFEFIAQNWGFELEIINSDSVILQKL